MWCSDCGQDIPGVASPENPLEVVCARCGQAPANATTSVDTGTRGGVAQATADLARQQTKVRDVLQHSLLDLDDWDLDEDLQTADDTIRSMEPTMEYPATFESTSATRMAMPLTPETGGRAHHKTHPALERREAGDSIATRRKPSLLGWTFVTLGMIGFACGAVLTGWSLAAGRTELWTMGVPTFLIGQAAILIGMIFQMEGLWHNDQQTRRSLDDLDERICQLNHSTKLLSVSHSSPSQTFYSHMAEGAPPHVLLADLKGQLDMLTTRVAAEHHR